MHINFRKKKELTLGGFSSRSWKSLSRFEIAEAIFWTTICLCFRFSPSSQLEQQVNMSTKTNEKNGDRIYLLPTFNKARSTWMPPTIQLSHLTSPKIWSRSSDMVSGLKNDKTSTIGYCTCNFMRTILKWERGRQARSVPRSSCRGWSWWSRIIIRIRCSVGACLLLDPATTPATE